MKYVFLHGLGQKASSWEKTLDFLSLEGDVLIPELFQLLQGKEVNYDNLYHSFEEYCNSLREPLTLIGLSLGGHLAMNYAINHPERVQAMVLIGTRSSLPKNIVKFQNLMMRLTPKSAFQDLGLAKQDVIRLTNSMLDVNLDGDLAKLSMPVLLLCGKKDRVNLEASRLLHQKLPNSVLVFVEHAGHQVNTDTPESFAQLLLEFFEKNSKK